MSNVKCSCVSDRWGKEGVCQEKELDSIACSISEKTNGLHKLITTMLCTLEALA